MATVSLQPILVDGVTLSVEVYQVAGSQNTSRLDKARDNVAGAFEDAQEAIAAIARSTAATIGTLQERAAAPHEVEVKFGLKFAVEGSVFVAGASSEASLEVTLKYKVDPQVSDQIVQ